MLRCEDCEFFHRASDGTPALVCDPYSSIKEPECLTKWQILELQTIAKSHRATLEMYRRLAPLQEKMIKHMEREIDDVDEADRWKQIDDEDEVEDEDDEAYRA